jgi:hypothetical protein
MQTQGFQIGDRVERLKGKQGEPAGTVVRIVEDDPQIVTVCWDGDDPFTVSVMPSATLMMCPLR